jgi:hypothetical protein
MSQKGTSIVRFFFPVFYRVFIRELERKVSLGNSL